MTKRVRISTLSAFLASVFAAGGLALAGGNNGDGARAVSGTNGNSLDTPFQAQARAFNRPGDVLISDQFNHRVIVVDRAKNIVTSWGTLNTPGYGTSNLNQGLNGPYDAKVVGDFTGLTPPHRSDHDADEPADGDLR